MRKPLVVGKFIIFFVLGVITQAGFAETWYKPNMGQGIHASVRGACDAHAERQQELSDENVSSNWDKRSIYTCIEAREAGNYYAFEQVRASDDKWQGSLGYYAQKIECAEDERLEEETLTCVAPISCNAGYTLNESGNECEARCPNGAGWDEQAQACIEPEAPQNCSTLSANPIDFIEGRKYRTEYVHSTGNIFPIKLIYRYNNQAGRENLGVTTLPAVSQSYVAATHPPHTTTSPGGSYVYDVIARHERRDTGNITRYWRHNFEEAVYARKDGSMAWHKHNGQIIILNSSGKNALYPGLLLRVLTEAEATEAGYSGHILIAGATSAIKQFDSEGRLRRITDPGTALYHSLQYGDDSELLSITHSLGAQLTFEYMKLNDLSKNATTDMAAYYLTTITDAEGRSVSVDWNEQYRGAVQSYALITRISRVSEIENNTYRAFYYENTDYPVAITRIDDVLDHSANIRQRYAEFNYDEQGRAIYSGLANGVDAITVDYVNDLTRKVTNALGKDATYTFAIKNGVKQLAGVTGEPTANCLQSETAFSYNDAGNKQTKTTNGIVTSYGYNEKGQRTTVTQATGTQEQRTVTTEWHPTLNKPSAIIEPTRTTRYVYDANEQLKEQQLEADGETRTTTYSYYANRLLHTVDGPRTDVSDITTYTYDTALNLASISNALGHTTLYSDYNSQGKATASPHSSATPLPAS